MDMQSGPPRFRLFSDKYLYFCEENQQGFRTITSHHVIVKRNWMQELLLCSTVVGLVACTFTLFSSTMAQGTGFFGISVLCVLVAAVVHRNGIHQELVVVMPTLGVQLETYYKSGKVFRRFFPMGCILAAVINEAVTPFTCYWYLALVVREEKNLALVFQELQPPLEMLVPIWKYLVGAIGGKTLQQSN